MNKDELAYSLVLEQRKLAGEICYWGFDEITFVLARGLRYTPDFFIVNADGMIEFHEFKGYWLDDAKAKIKMAAAKHPWFRFFGVRKIPKKDGGGYRHDEFQPPN